MSSFAPAFREYNRGSRGEMESRAALADARDRKRGRGRYDTRTEAQKRRENRSNLITVASFFIPVGWAFRGATRLHYGMKGAKPLVFTNRGKQSVRFYDTEAKRFISKRNYNLRQGLEQSPRKFYEGTKVGIRKIEETRVGRAARRIETAHTLVHRGPAGLVRQRILNRIISRPVQWGLAAAWGLSTGKDAVNDIQALLNRTDDSTPGGRRTPIIFNQYSGTERRSVHWVRTGVGNKFTPRCPSGYRYSSQANACLRIKP